MIKNYFFTIVTPAFNSDELIVRCMMNLQKNSVNFEHIIVDDCSKDSTIGIVEKYIEDNSINNIRLIRMEKNSGPGPARNKALDIAKGKYIVFCDADDYLYPGSLDKLESLLIKNNEPEICVFGYDVDHEIAKSKVLPRRDGLVQNNKVFLRDYILDYIISSPWAKVIKNTHLNEEADKIRFPDTRGSEDSIFNLEIFSSARSCLYIAESFYYFDKTGDSLTRKVFNEEEFQNLWESWNIFEQKAKKSSLDIQYKEEINARKLRFTCINVINRISISARDKSFKVHNSIIASIKNTALQSQYFTCKYMTMKEKLLISLFLLSPSFAIFLLNYSNTRKRD